MIKNITGLTLLAIFLLLLTGCPYGYKYDEGKFPAQPVNFFALNSVYDDYNAAAPFIESNRYLYFSSNRNSNGGEFDIVGKNMQIFWDKDDGMLRVDNTPHPWIDYDYTDSLFDRMNTPNNEFGPYSLAYNSYYSDAIFYSDIIIFSNDEPGKLDLKFVWFKGEDENSASYEGIYGGPEPISFLNTEFNDAYLSFFGEQYYMNAYSDPSAISGLLFCSDRNGQFDIFNASVPDNLEIIEFLQMDSSIAVLPVESINSGYQDKCPYANGSLLVFTSDRPGGFGGFDLYYSRREGNSWSDPVNFGDKINTEYDEYRPITLASYEFINDMMLFSSNRPGGKGGFDLYYVGITKMMDSYYGI